MKIPTQLQKSDFRFVLLGKWDSWKNKETDEVTDMPPENYEELKKIKTWQPLGKSPFEQKWQENGYAFDSEKLIKHIEEGNNFGVIGGYGRLRILDIDDKELGNILEDSMNTFTIQTGGGGKHFYFISDYDTNHVLVNELGELRANNYQVVSAPCRHPSGNYYTIVKDEEIREISAEDLAKLIRPYLKEKKDYEFKERPKDTSGSGLEYRRVIALIREGKTKEEIFNEMQKYTKWATHGSKYPQYREDTYNNALQFLESEEAKQEDSQQEEEKVNIIWDGELQDWEEEQKEWIINKLIPSRAVCVLTGKRGTMKTFIALLMSYCVSSGKDFLNKFPVQKGSVIYLDKENGIPIMKRRTRMIKAGIELNEQQEVGFICFSQLKIDKNLDLWKIEEKIEEYHPKLLVIDTYRRGISFDENDAGAVSKLFVDALRPLVEKHNISIILIHHNRKGIPSEYKDEMDEIRGSSDLANYADIILNMERKKGNQLVLKQLKNRNAMEEPPIEIEPIFNEDSVIMSYKGEYKTSSKIDKCVEDLCIWIEEDYLDSFQTKDAKEVAFRKGHKESTFKNALVQMQDAGLIKNNGFGCYNVSNKLQKN